MLSYVILGVKHTEIFFALPLSTSRQVEPPAPPSHIPIPPLLPGMVPTGPLPSPPVVFSPTPFQPMLPLPLLAVCWMSPLEMRRLFLVRVAVRLVAMATVLLSSVIMSVVVGALCGMLPLVIVSVEEQKLSLTENFQTKIYKHRISHKTNIFNT